MDQMNTTGWTGITLRPLNDNYGRKKMEKEILVKLTRQEIHKCYMLGNDTVKLCEMQKASPRLENDKQSRREANVYGFMAEFAVAKLLGLDKTDLTVASDFGIDLWWNDTSIDVKFTNRDDGDLIFDSMSAFKADIAVLVTKTNDKSLMKVCGWMSADDFAEKSEDHNYGHGDRLRVLQPQLEDIKDLWKKMKSEEWSR